MPLNAEEIPLSKRLSDLIAKFGALQLRDALIEMGLPVLRQARPEVPDVTIESLGLSSTTYNPIAKNMPTITTLWQMMQYTRDNLSQIRGLGDNGLNEIEEKLLSLGLKLPKITLAYRDLEDTEFDNIVKQVRIKLQSIFTKHTTPEVVKTFIELGMPIIEAPNPSSYTMIIETMRFSTQTYNCLLKASVLTLPELVSLTERNLMQIRGFGIKHLLEVREKVAEFGTQLPEQDRITDEKMSALLRTSPGHHTR
jgi:DNA-directed RNA polymerase alpha subunit